MANVKAEFHFQSSVLLVEWIDIDKYGYVYVVLWKEIIFIFFRSICKLDPSVLGWDKMWALYTCIYCIYYYRASYTGRKYPYTPSMLHHIECSRHIRTCDDAFNKILQFLYSYWPVSVLVTWSVDNVWRLIRKNMVYHNADMGYNKNKYGK